MFVVPLSGDVVEIDGGVKYTVLSYSAYKNQPAVYVETEGAATDSVSFDSIKTINGTPVALTPGKVFRADSLVKRKVQLPQKDDKIVVDGRTLKVKAIKLRQQGKLTDGVMVAAEDQETNQPVTVRMANIERIARANGDKDFARTTFRSLYKDYFGHKA